MAEPKKSPAVARPRQLPVVYTTHAQQMLRTRGITKAQVAKALATGTSRFDSKSRQEVFRLGGLRVVVKREATRIVIVTVTDIGTFTEYRTDGNPLARQSS